GQDMVQASALQMATVAATIADGGRHPTPTLLYAADPTSHGTRVISHAVARTVRGMMIDVVRFGTGTAAAIPGVVVAGKTGTAELGSPRCDAGAEGGAGSSGEGSEKPEAAEEGEAESCAGEQSDPQNTDAWFAAFAPALHPRIAVGVLLVKDGAGGE